MPQRDTFYRTIRNMSKLDNRGGRKNCTFSGHPPNYSALWISTTFVEENFPRNIPRTTFPNSGNLHFEGWLEHLLYVPLIRIISGNGHETETSSSRVSALCIFVRYVCATLDHAPYSFLWVQHRRKPTCLNTVLGSINCILIHLWLIQTPLTFTPRG